MRTRPKGRKEGKSWLCVILTGKDTWSTEITKHLTLSSTQNNFPPPRVVETWHFLSLSGDGYVLNRTPIILNEKHEVPRKEKQSALAPWTNNLSREQMLTVSVDRRVHYVGGWESWTRYSLLWPVRDEKLKKVRTSTYVFFSCWLSTSSLEPPKGFSWNLILHSSKKISTKKKQLLIRIGKN